MKHREALAESARRLLRPGAARPARLARRGSLSEPEESERNRLWKQRDNLFTFLDYEKVEATNNLAQRRLRPAVIQRELSCGNSPAGTKPKRGARTWEVLASLAATYAQRGRSFVELVAEAACFNPQLAEVS